MGLKSSLSPVILAVTGSMSLSTTVVAQGWGSVSYAAGNTGKPPVECARDAMAALSAGGFTDRLQVLSLTPPHQGAFGQLAARGPDAPQMMGLVICTEHRDIVVIVVGNGSQPYFDTLLQSLNRKQ